MTMSLVREGIGDVRAFVLPDGTTPDGRAAAFSRAVLVTWRSALEAMLYQIYVNGSLAGVTLDPQQRRLAIQAPSSFASAVQVDIVAVAPEEAHVDFSSDIGRSGVGDGRIKLTFLRCQSLPANAAINVYSDNGIGEIDYSRPLNRLPILVWACPQDKAGFGMAQFGVGDFGYDGAAAIGFGKGAFGHGQFSLDADTIEWISPALPLGQYRFGVKALDDQGTESNASETAPITVIPAAQPAAALEVLTFDEQANQLTLSISDRV